MKILCKSGMSGNVLKTMERKLQMKKTKLLKPNLRKIMILLKKMLMIKENLII